MPPDAENSTRDAIRLEAFREAYEWLHSIYTNREMSNEMVCLHMLSAIESLAKIPPAGMLKALPPVRNPDAQAKERNAPVS